MLKLGAAGEADSTPEGLMMGSATGDGKTLGEPSGQVRNNTPVNNGSLQKRRKNKQIFSPDGSGLFAQDLI